MSTAASSIWHQRLCGAPGYWRGVGYTSIFTGFPLAANPSSPAAGPSTQNRSTRPPGCRVRRMLPPPASGKTARYASSSGRQ
ncbi:hypothetical protein [Nonomuraea sp. NPDC050202]|uniref:hypothetical protein n=1 Tax=Nonomuraea sp. NPDC050202 TaxID=3155035 RepID=UPI0033D3995B